MRNFIRAFAFIFLTIIIFSCQKDDDYEMSVHNSDLQLRSNSIFTDTSGWEIVSVSNALIC
jgi:hypothetical protein